MEILDSRLETAIEVAKKAGAYALEKQKRGSFEVQSKHLNDFVTDVDKNTEKLIFSEIKKYFPNDGFFGEESGDKSGTGRWIVDPIDGTTNYFRGLPNWAISIAYEVDLHEPILGIVYLPCYDEIYYAVKGKGAYLNGKPISCSKNDSLDNSLVVCVPPHRHKEFYDDYIERMIRIGKACSDIRSFGTAAQEIVYIASGKIDAYYELFLGYYDFAAAQVILEEAGGKLENISKTKEFTDYDCDILVSNTLISDSLKNIIYG